VRGTEQEAKKDACRPHHSEDLTSVEDIVGSIRIYWRDKQCLNNFVMDIIVCPEAVSGFFEWSSYFIFM
jgi:hypothetical protein